MTIQYAIKFFDYWHTGSGLSGGTYADLLVNKTLNGFPLVPGKTVKGLLRHAAEDLLSFGDPAVTQGLIDQLFGARPSPGRQGAQPEEDGLAPDGQRVVGTAWFSNAILPEADRLLLKKEDLKRHLYEVLSSTAIDAETGTATDHTLRQIEVTVPCELQGTISGVDDSAHLLILKRSMNYIKRLGQQRSRGLGRCEFKIITP